MTSSASENTVPENEELDVENIQQDATDSNADEIAVELSVEEQLVQAQAKATENWDLYLRAVAEADNARRRAEQEVSKARKFALEKFSSDLLDIVDNFEMGIAASRHDNATIESIREGNELTLKQLVQILERYGVKGVTPEGEKFDPQLHEAISMQPSAEHAPNTVMLVVQKGYTISDRLLRPARVIVSSKPPESNDS